MERSGALENERDTLRGGRFHPDAPIGLRPLLFEIIGTFCALGLIALIAGCSVGTIRLIPVDDQPLRPPVRLDLTTGELERSDQTRSTVRNYLFLKKKGSTLDVLVRMEGEIKRRPTLALLFSFTELAYQEGLCQEKKNPPLAAELYIASALHGYRYLFDPKFENERSPYDSEFRIVSLYYNRSVERLLRLIHDSNGDGGGDGFFKGNKAGGEALLRPGSDVVLETASGEWKLRCRLADEAADGFSTTSTSPSFSGSSPNSRTERPVNWTSEEIGSFLFVSDFKMVGMKNHYSQEGLGVPVIVTRRRGGNRLEETYYPPNLALPMTLFLRPNPAGASPVEGRRNGESLRSPDSLPAQAILEFHNPFVSPTTRVGKANVPLEYDLTAALAYNFNDPRTHLLGTIGLTNPDAFSRPLTDESLTGRSKTSATSATTETASSDVSQNQARRLEGLYLMEPYDPRKIPVVMVHGLWSSPMTWLEMVNSLQSSEEIRNNYQFWFWFYPTGLPWWVSAARLRDDLADIRDVLDPQRREDRLDRMVLIGHSMGGLISRLQVSASGDDLWKLVSDLPLSEIGTTKVENLQKWFFFEPSPSIRRVITIATPFHGSKKANNFTQWLAERLIETPNILSETISFQSGRAAEGKDSKAIGGQSLLLTKNSIESLAPESPIFSVLESLYVPDQVVLNNIVGVREPSPIFSAPKGDGVVRFESAHQEGGESELEVPAAHMTIHTEPAAIRETNRILLEHLYQMNLEQVATRTTAKSR